MDKRNESRKQIAVLEAEIKRLSALVHAPSEDELTKEQPDLQRLSLRVTWYLLTCLVVSVVFLAVLVAYGPKDVPTTLAIAGVAGFLGSSVAALLSINERVAYGWVFRSGNRTPAPDEKKERFNARLVRGFVSRPFVGVVAGLLVFFGCVSGVLWKVPQESTFTLTFWCLLGGIFAKTLLDKLKEVLKNLVGKSAG
jgi:hypothetical protein